MSGQGHLVNLVEGSDGQATWYCRCGATSSEPAPRTTASLAAFVHQINETDFALDQTDERQA